MKASTTGWWLCVLMILLSAMALSGLSGCKTPPLSPAEQGGVLQVTVTGPGAVTDLWNVVYSIEYRRRNDISYERYVTTTPLVGDKTFTVPSPPSDAWTTLIVNVDEAVSVKARIVAWDGTIIEVPASFTSGPFEYRWGPTAASSGRLPQSSKGSVISARLKLPKDTPATECIREWVLQAWGRRNRIQLGDLLMDKVSYVSVSAPLEVRVLALSMEGVYNVRTQVPAEASIDLWTGDAAVVQPACLDTGCDRICNYHLENP